MGSAVARHRENTGPGGTAASSFAGCHTGTTTNRRSHWMPAANKAAEKTESSRNLTAVKSSSPNASSSSPGSIEARRKVDVKKPEPPPPPPAVSCLVPSKHLPSLRKPLEWELSPLSNAQRAAMNRGQASPKLLPTETTGTDEKPNETGRGLSPTPMSLSGPPTQESIRKKDIVVRKPPFRTRIECDEGLPTSVEPGSDGTLPSKSTKKNTPHSGAFNSLASNNLDSRSSDFFGDFVARGFMPFRDTNLQWFNVDFDRKLLKRREHCDVVWCPIEEIALPEVDETSKEAAKETPESPIAEEKVISVRNPKKPQQQQQQQQRQPKRDNSNRPRIRPILSSDVPHRMQLAKKAIEDNVIFIYSRAPKLY
ncbi:hypothetical protein C3747_328g6 [Trypanosoma cruzi]|uniref:Uncharacterized protein n=1 Tax=Trypanosoma cruzi TaxID=5693 RepID=A0A2V2V6E3_TRYCR|nr:hypothetical protein C3747_328g6 [Trypanosoma cruzi]